MVFCLSSTSYTPPITSRRLALWFCAAAISSCCAQASDRVLTETDLLGPIPLITAATRLSQTRADAPAAITVIDRVMIDASGAQEISDLFRLVPGFQAYHVNGHKFGVTAHGLGAPFPGRLEVMLDGRSIYLTAFSSPDWRTLGIGLADIDRIEVSRSPSVSSWGSNAFQGAINIITLNPMMHRNSHIRLTGGDNNNRRLEVSQFGEWGLSAIRVSAGYQKDDGYSPKDAGQSRYASLRQVFSQSLVDEVELQLGFTSGYGGVGDNNADILGRRYFDSRHQSLTWLRSLDAGQIQVRAYHNYLNYHMQRISPQQLLGFPPEILGIADEPLPSNMEEGNTNRYDIELQHQSNLSQSLRGLWGIGGRVDDGQAPLLLNTDERLRADYWRLFGNLEWKPAGSWTWNSGVMLENSDLAGTQLSPRLALNYRLDTVHSFRGSYSLAHRTPSLLEAKQDTRLTDSNGNLLLWLYNSDSNLDAEENRTFELGYLGLISAYHLEVDLRLFNEQVSHGIGRQRTASAEFQLIPPPPDKIRVTHTNNAEWRSNGIEVQLRYQPSPERLVTLAYGYLDTHGGVTLGNADNPSDPETDFSNAVPRHTLALLGTQQLHSGLSLSAALYHQSDTQWLAGSQIDAYTRVDLRLAKTFKLGNSIAELALVAQNLGDDYTEFQQRNRFETRTFITFNLALE